jgi:hypothetical protein
VVSAFAIINILYVKFALVLLLTLLQHHVLKFELTYNSIFFIYILRKNEFLYFLEALRQCGELGPAMDVLVNEHNTKQGWGAVDILTNGLSSRQAVYEQLVAMAAAAFVTEYYND